ncbi:hypothetical protein [Arthrobacter sp. STN4]|uniref:hypothetical protein n=1 Tax=Arthrobacter sp. STN4 TaxID=2923276 RepID=UPI00211A6D17|nr:hypothetical protein [Arthrobacter sp. STN4]MCQ9164174.1 hypothetical protein [Arthrobacter sp. STN4]
MAGDMSPFVMAGRRMPTNIVVHGVGSFHAGESPEWQIILILGGVFGGDMTMNIKASAGGIGLWQGSDLVFGPARMNGIYVTELRTVRSLTRETI